ncbi:MAG: hypothetical protein V7K98_14150 [Nostoc sp.]
MQIRCFLAYQVKVKHWYSLKLSQAIAKRRKELILKKYRPQISKRCPRR